MSDFKVVERIQVNEKTEIIISKFQDKIGNDKYYVNTQFVTKTGDIGYSKGLSLPQSSCKKLGEALMKL